MPVVIGLSVSSLLWYWLFSYHYGLINRFLLDIGLIDKPIVWFGEDADRALWAVIVSIVWKVVGFGMLLFVAAIQAIPQEINEATMVDGASYWQRVWRITAAADGADDPSGHALQRHRLAARLRPVLPDDRRPAVQPTASSVFWLYLNSFPYLKLGYGATLSLILAVIILACTVVQMWLTPSDTCVKAATR